GRHRPHHLRDDAQLRPAGGRPGRDRPRLGQRDRARRATGRIALALRRPDGGDCAPVDDAVFIGGPEKRDIVIEDYDPAWTARFEQVDAALRQALGEKARRSEHVGSTAGPGLGAKGIVDVLVTVDDADDEPAYGPSLQAAGFSIRLRQ